YKRSMSISNPQSLNRYAYVQNDPANFVDPTGLVTVCYYSLWGYRIDVPGYPGGIQPLYRLDFCMDYPDPRRQEPREPREFQHPRRRQPKPTTKKVVVEDVNVFNDCMRQWAEKEKRQLAEAVFWQSFKDQFD